jgi:hypothetical protein
MAHTETGEGDVTMEPLEEAVDTSEARAAGV